MSYLQGFPAAQITNIRRILSAGYSSTRLEFGPRCLLLGFWKKIFENFFIAFSPSLSFPFFKV